MLEKKIKSTELELNQVRERLEQKNPYQNHRSGIYSTYGNISRMNSHTYVPSYKTSQPWATHEGYDQISDNSTIKSYGNHFNYNNKTQPIKYS